MSHIIFPPSTSNLSLPTSLFWGLASKFPASLCGCRPVIYLGVMTKQPSCKDIEKCFFLYHKFSFISEHNPKLFQSLLGRVSVYEYEPVGPPLHPGLPHGHGSARARFKLNLIIFTKSVSVFVCPCISVCLCFCYLVCPLVFKVMIYLNFYFSHYDI